MTLQFKKIRAALLLCVLAAQGAGAATINFATAPFAGSKALTTAGRQVSSLLEQTLPNFAAGDVFSFDAGVFSLGSSLTFVNTLAFSLPPAVSRDVIVLQDSDNDSNPATTFGAGSAANLIAARLTSDGDGFFVYFNSFLGVNRLVYSTNLNEPTADLSILARISSPTGPKAIDALPTFTAANFAVTPVPEPSTYALMLVGLLGGAVISRRSKKVAA